MNGNANKDDCGGNGDCANMNEKKESSGTLEQEKEEIDDNFLDVIAWNPHGAFLEFTRRLENLKICMIEFYGNNRDVEYRNIVNEMYSILTEVRSVKDRGDVRTIVTREDYEDYICEQLKRFHRLVEINEAESRASIYTGGTASTTRMRRSVTSIQLN